MLVFLANELITRDQVALCAPGFVVWFLTVEAIPFFVLLDRGVDWPLLQSGYGRPAAIQGFVWTHYAGTVLTPLLFIRCPGDGVMCPEKR